MVRRDSAYEHAYASHMGLNGAMDKALSPYSSPLTHRSSRTFGSPLHGRPQADTANTQVIPERIRSGDDVRTTVMIRNIPNKVDVEEFKKILNNAAFGKYDFSYLRIDFQNMCNVGYAFVNFTEAEHIILLYDEIVGKRWNIFNSDKIAEMCYATIQGLDCCIDKVSLNFTTCIKQTMANSFTVPQQLRHVGVGSSSPKALVHGERRPRVVRP